MRPIQPQRRRSSAGFWLSLLLIVVAGIGGTVAMFWLMALGPWSVAVEDSFMVRIPINSRPIVAYSSVQREDLLNPATRKLTFQKIPPASVVGMGAVGVSTEGTPVDGRIDSVKNDNGNVVLVIGGKDVPQSQVTELGGALMNVSTIIGRVVKKDKRAGMGFREATFFPRGTPEGIAGATPPGMRAITLDATHLQGIHSLQAGNRLDLLASFPIGQSAVAGTPDGLLTNQQPDTGDRKEPVLLAQNALLLRPVSVRNEATSTSSLTSGKRLVNEPRYEVTIAVTPEDVIPLQNALDQELKITCLATSMRIPTESESPQVLAESNQLMAPVTMRAIPAYAVITREAFINPATRTIRQEPINDQDVVMLGVQTRLEEMLGAVARHDIPAGSFIRKGDLLATQRQQKPPLSGLSKAESNAPAGLPWRTTTLANPQQSAQSGANIVGDRPAVTSFVPPGRVAIAVPWSRIFGSEHLQIDDHFDLLASYPLERRRDVRSTEARADENVVSKEYDEYVARGTDRTRDESLAERGEPWFIATDAIVIGPVGFPPPAAAMRAIGDRASDRRNRQDLSGPAILLAIDSRDVESMATVLNTSDVLLSAAFRAHADQVTPRGFRHIAVAPVEMPAYTEFSDLQWKGLRREITGRLVRTDDPRFDDAISIDAIDQYYGRVLNTEKARYSTFRDKDFLPAGAKAGVAAALDSNSVLVNVTSDQVQALNRFQENDQVALLLTGNRELPPGALVHSSNIGPSAQVVVQSVRIIQAASDISDTIALAVPQDDVAALTAALFRHDATDSSGRHDFRLLAVARHRTDTKSSEPDPQPVAALTGFDPLMSAPQIYEVVGGNARTHYFAADSEN